ncbi:hypothetical protein TNCV_1851221 [Trichonephila clavipes]|nr:hypothetical protein TNCV_1851221 [Trichonephila clavipes]
MSLPNPVEQKSHDVINNKLSRVMKEVAEESMKMAAVEEYSSSPDNLLTVSVMVPEDERTFIVDLACTVIGGRKQLGADWRKIVESLNNTVLILLARLLKTDRQQSNRCTIKLIVRFIFGLPRKEDGETNEFLTDDGIAEAVTQEPMEGGGESDTTRRNAR